MKGHSNIQPSVSDRFGARVGHLASRSCRLFLRYWKPFLLYQILCFTSVLFYLFILNGHQSFNPSIAKRYHVYHTPEECKKHHRIATLLAFLIGGFGADQFYSHHWPLACFKLLTCGSLGIWWYVDCILWIIGTVYGLPGCPGGYHGL